MKLAILATFLFCALSFAGHAEEPKKYYCPAGNIELTDEMILVHHEGRLFEIDSLLADQGGIYFTENMIRCTQCRRPLNPKNTCECPSR